MESIFRADYGNRFLRTLYRAGVRVVQEKRLIEGPVCDLQRIVLFGPQSPDYVIFLSVHVGNGKGGMDDYLCKKPDPCIKVLFEHLHADHGEVFGTLRIKICPDEIEPVIYLIE